MFSAMLVLPMPHGLHHGGDGHQPADAAALAQRVDAALGGLEHGVGLARALVDHLVDLVGGLAQTAQQRPVAHDGRVLEHVRRGGRDAHDLGQVLLAVVLIHAADLHLVQHRDRVDRLRVREHGVDRLVNAAVEREIELVRLQLFQHLRHAPGVDEHGADDRLLRRGGVGHLPAQQFIHEPYPLASQASMTRRLILPLVSKPSLALTV